jgi:hypothetical protein
MRGLIEATVKLLECGQISLELATDQLQEAGVPFKVVCRLLSKFRLETKVEIDLGKGTHGNVNPK